MPHRLPASARLALAGVKVGVVASLLVAGIWTSPDLTPGPRVDAARVGAAPSPGRSPAPPPAVSPALSRLLARHQCSVQGFGTTQQPQSAVIRSAAGDLRFVDFDTGWQVYTRHGAATLVAVCLDAPVG